MNSERLRQLVIEHTEIAVGVSLQHAYARPTVGAIEAELLGTSPTRRAVILDGPRRTGKSVALRQVLARLRAADPTRAMYCDFTDIRLRGVGIQELVQAVIAVDRDPSLPGFLLLDEVHYTGQNWARELKFVIDNMAVRICVVDSALAVVRASFREHLVGRVVHLHMHPLSFGEWRELSRTIGLPTATLQDDASMAQECRDYLQLGGSPTTSPGAVRRVGCTMPCDKTWCPSQYGATSDHCGGYAKSTVWNGCSSRGWPIRALSSGCEMQLSS